MCQRNKALDEEKITKIRKLMVSDPLKMAMLHLPLVSIYACPVLSQARSNQTSTYKTVHFHSPTANKS
jgi:hypothetical protein